MREHVQAHGQHRDRRERELLTEAPGQDGWEKTSWLKAQRAALELLEKMDTLISRSFVSQRLAEVGRVVQDAIEKIAPRISHELAAERSADKIRTILEREHRSALSALANALEMPARELPAAAEPIPPQKKNRGGTKRSKPLQIQ